MKHKLFLLAFAAILFAGCEKKQVADVKDLTISFEYREVEGATGYCDFEFRSTSTPSYVAPDLWYDFGKDHAMAIGDGHHRFKTAGTYNVTVMYKPGVDPEPNKIHASRTFTFTLTGVSDSTWKAATPTDL